MTTYLPKEFRRVKKYMITQGFHTKFKEVAKKIGSHLEKISNKEYFFYHIAYVFDLDILFLRGEGLAFIKELGITKEEFHMFLIVCMYYTRYKGNLFEEFIS